MFMLLSACGAEAVMSAEDFLKLCSAGTPQEVETEIKAGADVEAKDNDGMTALLLAARQNGNPEVSSVLIQAGADVNAKNNGGMTPLMWAAEWNNAEVLNVLIQGGADVNAKDNGGMTALMLAAMRNNEALNSLVEAGADVNAEMDDGTTLLMWAVRYGENPENISALIRAGAVVSENDVELAQKNDRLKDTGIIEELKSNLKK